MLSINTLLLSPILYVADTLSGSNNDALFINKNSFLYMII